MSEVPSTRQERKKDAWARVGTGLGLGVAGGSAAQMAAKDLIKRPASRADLVKPHALRLFQGGSKGKAVTSLAGRGVQLAGLGLVGSGATNLQRERMKTKRPLAAGDVASDVARRTVGAKAKPGHLEAVDRRRTARTPAGRDRLRAEGAKAATVTAGTMAGLLGSQALGRRSIPARVALGTLGGAGMAAVTTPIAQRKVSAATKGKVAMTDTGDLVRKAQRLSRTEKEERKKILGARQAQTGLSVAGGALGLTGMGMLVAPKGAKTVAGRMRKPPRSLTALGEKKLPYQAVTTAGAGVGGASALNYARLSHRESSKDKRDLGIKKSDVRADLAASVSKARLPRKALGRSLRRRPSRTSRQPAMRNSHIRRTSSGKMVRVRGSVG